MSKQPPREEGFEQDREAVKLIRPTMDLTAWFISLHRKRRYLDLEESLRNLQMTLERLDRTGHPSDMDEARAYMAQIVQQVGIFTEAENLELAREIAQYFSHLNDYFDQLGAQIK